VTVKLSTTLNNLERSLSSEENKQIILRFFDFMKRIGTGNVTYIVDGDTLDLNDIRVRLSLVDTPERGQPGFREAKDFVSSLCLGKKGELDVDDGQRRGDRYGREIGIVYCNGVNLNEKLMDEQLARILTDYCEISEFSKESWAMLQCNVMPNPSSLDSR
jgi:endonuclease YncB( thermonuclease family)